MNVWVGGGGSEAGTRGKILVGSVYCTPDIEY
jgi:hypothetical protein